MFYSYEGMKLRKYTTEYPITDMNCFKIYCGYKGIKMGEKLREILNNFLADHSDEINMLMDKQKKIVESRIRQRKEL